MDAGEHVQNGMRTGRKYRFKRDVRVIGWREWLAIPEWGVARIKAKIDTGARTSSLHAEGLHFFRRGGKDMVRFRVHPHQRSPRRIVLVEAEVVDKRVVRSSNGDEELRPVVRANIELHGVCWPIEVTLAKRKLMGFRMLLGREAMWRRFVVDPGKSYLGGEPMILPEHLVPKLPAEQSNAAAMEIVSNPESGSEDNGERETVELKAPGAVKKGLEK